MYNRKPFVEYGAYSLFLYGKVINMPNDDFFNRITPQIKDITDSFYRDSVFEKLCDYAAFSIEKIEYKLAQIREIIMEMKASTFYEYFQTFIDYMSYSSGILSCEDIRVFIQAIKSRNFPKNEIHEEILLRMETTFEFIHEYMAKNSFVNCLFDKSLFNILIFYMIQKGNKGENIAKILIKLSSNPRFSNIIHEYIMSKNLNEFSQLLLHVKYLYYENSTFIDQMMKQFGTNDGLMRFSIQSLCRIKKKLELDKDTNKSLMKWLKSLKTDSVYNQKLIIKSTVFINEKSISAKENKIIASLQETKEVGIFKCFFKYKGHLIEDVNKYCSGIIEFFFKGDEISETAKNGLDNVVQLFNMLYKVAPDPIYEKVRSMLDTNLNTNATHFILKFLLSLGSFSQKCPIIKICSEHYNLFLSPNFPYYQEAAPLILDFFINNTTKQEGILDSITTMISKCDFKIVKPILLSLGDILNKSNQNSFKISHFNKLMSHIIFELKKIVDKQSLIIILETLDVFFENNLSLLHAKKHEDERIYYYIMRDILINLFPYRFHVSSRIAAYTQRLILMIGKMEKSSIFKWIKNYCEKNEYYSSKILYNESYEDYKSLSDEMFKVFNNSKLFEKQFGPKFFVVMCTFMNDFTNISLSFVSYLKEMNYYQIYLAISNISPKQWERIVSKLTLSDPSSLYILFSMTSHRMFPKFLQKLSPRLEEIIKSFEEKRNDFLLTQIEVLKLSILATIFRTKKIIESKEDLGKYGFFKRLCDTMTSNSFLSITYDQMFIFFDCLTAYISLLVEKDPIVIVKYLIKLSQVDPIDEKKQNAIYGVIWQVFVTHESHRKVILLELFKNSPSQLPYLGTHILNSCEEFPINDKCFLLCYSLALLSYPDRKTNFLGIYIASNIISSLYPSFRFQYDVLFPYFPNSETQIWEFINQNISSKIEYQSFHSLFSIIVMHFPRKQIRIPLAVTHIELNNTEFMECINGFFNKYINYGNEEISIINEFLSIIPFNVKNDNVQQIIAWSFDQKPCRLISNIVYMCYTQFPDLVLEKLFQYIENRNFSICSSMVLSRVRDEKIIKQYIGPNMKKLLIFSLDCELFKINRTLGVPPLLVSLMCSSGNHQFCDLSSNFSPLKDSLSFPDLTYEQCEMVFKFATKWNPNIKSDYEFLLTANKGFSYFVEMDTELILKSFIKSVCNKNMKEIIGFLKQLLDEVLKRVDILYFCEMILLVLCIMSINGDSRYISIVYAFLPQMIRKFENNGILEQVSQNFTTIIDQCNDQCLLFYLAIEAFGLSSSILSTTCFECLKIFEIISSLYKNDINLLRIAVESISKLVEISGLNVNSYSDIVPTNLLNDLILKVNNVIKNNDLKKVFILRFTSLITSISSQHSLFKNHSSLFILGILDESFLNYDMIQDFLMKSSFSSKRDVLKASVAWINMINPSREKIIVHNNEPEAVSIIINKYRN